MKKLWYFILATLILTITLSGCSRREVLIPAPKLNVTVEEDQIAKSIVNGMSDLGWIMTSDEPGHIVANLNVRQHQVDIDILYDAEQISFNYKSSVNLRYSMEDGNQYIHRKYNAWIKNLMKEIQLEMQRNLTKNR